MTWFIIEYDSSKIDSNKYTIVGVDEFQNVEYLSELNRGKPTSISYNMVESKPRLNYNDNTYYVNNVGKIKWRSDEQGIETPIDITPGTSLNPYVFVISGNESFKKILKEKGGLISAKADKYLARYGYEMQFVGFNDLGEYQIAFYKKGTEPISITFIILIGIVALIIAFVAYQIRFTIKSYMDNKTLIARENTNTAWIDGNKAIAQDTNAPQDDRERARKNLTGNIPPPGETPPEEDGSFLGGLSIGTIIALIAVIYFLTKKE